MKQSNSANRLKEAAVLLFRDGYSEVEIVRNKLRLAEIHRLGPEWETIRQSSLNRWIKAAKDKDSDLEIWHLLNRRRRRPDSYTNWQPNGKVILAQYYEPLEDTLYLGPGVSFIPTRSRVPSKIVETDPEWRSRRQKAGTPLRETDAVGPYVAELKSLDYSIRDIVALWGQSKTRHSDVDKTRRVKWLIRQIRSVRQKPMSYSTVRRILQTYSTGPVAESFMLTQMADFGDLYD